MSGSVRFLQISDLHLGARVLPRCFANTSSVTQHRQEEILLALASLKDVCKETKTEVVLVVGDLFDRDSVSEEIVNRTFQIFSELPPVYIVPGNHDYMSGASPYSKYERSRRGLDTIPENVHVFTSNEFTSVYLTERPDVSITAQAFKSNVSVTMHPLADKLSRDPAEISILMLHGSRTQFAFEEKQKITAPFTATELLAQNFSYTALGHYHSYSTIENADGMIKAAYSGMPFACEFKAKNGCALTGVITPSGVQELVEYDIDTRKIFDLSVYCDNVESNEELLILAKSECAKNEVLNDDIVRFRFIGTKKTDFKPELLIPDGELFVSTYDVSELSLGYDIEELLAVANSKGATAESLFIRQMYDKLALVEDDEEKMNIVSAIDYGMKALRGIRVTPKEIVDNQEV